MTRPALWPKNGFEAMTPEQKKSNFRLAVILASTAFAFFLGFLIKMIFFVPR